MAQFTTPHKNTQYKGMKNKQVPNSIMLLNFARRTDHIRYYTSHVYGYDVEI